MDIEYLGTSSSFERPMGTETLYEFDTNDVVCDNCGKNFHVNGFISIYPPGAINRRDINIEPLEEDL